jgi:SAM-dependent methyltransferase
MTTNTYLLGDSDPELRRLADQHRVWSDVTHAAWDRAGISSGDRILDVGCGPGFTTIELARRTGPSGEVVGIDPSSRFHAHLLDLLAAEDLANVVLRQCGIHEFEEADGFDLINVRWVLCFLDDLQAAVDRLATLLRPGGRLLTLDYFNYAAFAMAPRIECMAAVVAAVAKAWAGSGGSLEVQGDTARACANAGLTVADIEQVSGIARPGEPRFEWPRDFLGSFVPRLIDDGLLDPGTAEAFWDGWRARAQQPGSFLYLPPMLRIIARK